MPADQDNNDVIGDKAKRQQTNNDDNNTRVANNTSATTTPWKKIETVEEVMERCKKHISGALYRAHVLTRMAERNIEYGSPNEAEGCILGREPAELLLGKLDEIFGESPKPDRNEPPVNKETMQLAEKINKLWAVWRVRVMPRRK
ncbi:hypothetical protein CHU98_g11082 [Xylaria longipes]|nr:hypothetical protein CHU98_g11082 [Xylaria longipes]